MSLIEYKAKIQDKKQAEGALQELKEKLNGDIRVLVESYQLIPTILEAVSFSSHRYTFHPGVLNWGAFSFCF